MANLTELSGKKQTKQNKMTNVDHFLILVMISDTNKH